MAVFDGWEHRVGEQWYRLVEQVENFQLPKTGHTPLALTDNILDSSGWRRMVAHLPRNGE